MLVLLSLSTLWVGVSSNAIFAAKTVGWHSPDVIYKIGDMSKQNFTEKHIKEAFTWYTENTCINFIDYREPAAAGKAIDLRVEDRDNCEFANGVFEIGSCIGQRSIMVHETMHYLGLFHTEYRPDYQQHMTILPGVDLNFTSKNAFYAPPGVKYDYGSIMHDFFFEDEVKLLDDLFYKTAGQRLRVSFTDAQSLNWLFNCSGKCTTQLKCLNGGYTHPRDCNKCMCNKYFSGTLCETPKNVIKLDCATKKQHVWLHNHAGNATLAAQRILSDDFRYHGEDLWDIIEAPQGTQVHVSVRSQGSAWSGTSCSVKAVEINDGDLNLVGKMFCDPGNNGVVIMHNFTAASNTIGFHAEYGMDFSVKMEAKFTLLGCDAAVPPTTTSTKAPTTTATASTSTTTTTVKPSTTTTSTTSAPQTTTTATPKPITTTTGSPLTTTVKPSTTTTVVPPVTTTAKPDECEY